MTPSPKSNPKPINRKPKPATRDPKPHVNVGALIIRIGAWGLLIIVIV